jgi:hypothetical protein
VVRSRTLLSIPLWVLLVGLSGCGGSDSLPSAPSVVPPQAVVPPPPPRTGTWLDGYTLTGVSLSGTVYESTPTGPMPIAGAWVYCELCGEATHTAATADTNGFYSFPGDLANGGGVWLSAGVSTPVLVWADGYYDPSNRNGQRYALIVGDTRLDFELARR